MAAARKSTAPRKIRMYSYRVECRIGQVGTAEKDLRVAAVVADTHEHALAAAREQLGVDELSPFPVEYVVMAATEIGPDEALVWAAWHDEAAAAASEYVAAPNGIVKAES